MALDDNEARVRGEALFTGDLKLEGMLYGAILRSPYAHAKIVSIDTTRARALDGVEAVLTSRDLADVKYVHMPRFSDRHVLAQDKVRFHGDEVAAVAASDQQQARRAIALIDVEYQSLAYAETSKRALRRYFPGINGGPGGGGPGGGRNKNLATTFARDHGDVDASDARASLHLEGQYEHGASLAACLESSGTLAHFDEASQTLKVWTVSQAPFVVRWELAEVLQLEREQIQVMPVSVGASPSARAYCGEHAAIAAALSMASNRPVKLMLAHHEDAATSRADPRQEIKLRQSLDSDGNILARGVSVLVDHGAYASLAPAHLIAGRQIAAGLYRVQTARFDWRLAYSNTLAGGRYPLLGLPQMLWAIEDQMDRAAAALDMDPLDYRLRQANRLGDVTPLGWRVQGAELSACLAEAAQRINWKEKGKVPYRGLGLAACVWPSAGVLRGEDVSCEVALELQANGRLLLAVQWVTADGLQNRLVRQMCARALNLSEHLIDVVATGGEQAGQSMLAPHDETVVLVDAVGDAAQRFLSRLRGGLSTAIGMAADEILLDGDGIKFSKGRRKPPTLAEVHSAVGACASVGTAPRSVLQTQAGEADLSELLSFGAQAAEVEVDPLTGSVRVRRLVLALDLGEVLDAPGIEAEVRRGLMDGLGMALGQCMRYDAGKPVTTSPSQLGVPRFHDMPRLEIVCVPSQSTAGPFGAKATGESAAHAAMAAIANAVADATGERVESLPITQEKVLAALGSASLKGNSSKDKSPKDESPKDSPSDQVPKDAWQEIPTYAWAEAGNLRDAALRGVLTRPLVRRPMPPPDTEDFSYVVARDVAEALESLLFSDVSTKIRAGGTDLTPGIKQGVYRPQLVVDISRIDKLRGVVRTHNCLRIGACTSLSELQAHPEILRLFPVLAEGARKIANTQVRTLATVGGNLCQQKQCAYLRNAFPCRKLTGSGHTCFAYSGDHHQHSIMHTWPCAAPCPSDLAPLLDVLDAELVIASKSAERRVSMAGFYRWSGEPKLAPDELLLAIELPLSASPRSTVFEKRAQSFADFASASVAVSVGQLQGRVESSRISLGGVSPFPERAHLAERLLVDQKPSDALLREAARATVRGALPMRMNANKVPLVVDLAERALRLALKGGQ